MKQRTIQREVSKMGKGLHCGEECTLTLKPAPVDHGVVFQRTDLEGRLVLRLSPTSVAQEMIRQTTLQQGDVEIQTPEHVLSALMGCHIDNVVIELHGKECPIVDGSARPWIELIEEAGVVEQDKEKDFFELKQIVSVENGKSSIVALPYDGLKITCTSQDDRGIHTQHLSLDIDQETYIKEVSPSRTFTVYEDIEPLLKMGKIQGGSLECAVVIKGDKILSKESLRFDDEFVRHKILDILGDIALLGKPLKAHIVAIRPGHALNNKLAIKLSETMESETIANTSAIKSSEPERSEASTLSETWLSTKRVLEIVPQAYPFVMIDRVVELTSENELTAVKNVSINEPFFQGHFPGNPVFPGVLQIESMAQAAGVLMLRKAGLEGSTAFFMSAEKVKFRKAVVPGDQVMVHAKIIKIRGNKVAVAQCECTVDGKVVSSAELMFTIAPAV